MFFVCACCCSLCLLVMPLFNRISGLVVEGLLVCLLLLLVLVAAAMQHPITHHTHPPKTQIRSQSEREEKGA